MLEGCDIYILCCGNHQHCSHILRFHKFYHTTVGHENCIKKNRNKWHNTIQNKQMSVQQSPKSNTVHNIIIKQNNTNYNRDNLSNQLSLLNSKNSLTE